MRPMFDARLMRDARGCAEPPHHHVCRTSAKRNDRAAAAPSPTRPRAGARDLLCAQMHASSAFSSWMFAACGRDEIRVHLHQRVIASRRPVHGLSSVNGAIDRDEIGFAHQRGRDRLFRHCSASSTSAETYGVIRKHAPSGTARFTELARGVLPHVTKAPMMPTGLARSRSWPMKMLRSRISAADRRGRLQTMRLESGASIASACSATASLFCRRPELRQSTPASVAGLQV